MTDLMVELSTPSGPFFSANATAIDVRTEDGSIHITPREESYLSLINATEITMDDTHEAAEDICTVCGSDARECREPLSQLRHSAKLISICSPKCMEAFQREPDRFAADGRARPAVNSRALNL